MYFQLSRLSIATIKQKGYKSQFTGSSRFKVGNNHITEKETGINSFESLEKIQLETIKKKNESKEKLYRLKKGKIRNKILNYFHLNKSKKFCAFYSISFPLDIPDELAYKVFNTWLTRCRKESGLISYLWVAERQKNNTIHFHLITHNFLQISKVNAFMRSALLTQYTKGNLSYDINKLNRYNGIDVDNILNSKRHKGKSRNLSTMEAQNKLMFYLSKYVSKNDTLSNRLPWHCSRDISALFTTQNFANENNVPLFQLIADNPEAVHSIKGDYFAIHFFRFQPDPTNFTELEDLNNCLHDELMRREEERRKKTILPRV